jgi:hypothetical protein
VHMLSQGSGRGAANEMSTIKYIAMQQLLLRSPLLHPVMLVTC